MFSSICCILVLLKVVQLALCSNKDLFNFFCLLSFSTNAALEIFALDLSSGDAEMPLAGTVASEHRWVIQLFNSNPSNQLCVKFCRIIKNVMIYQKNQIYQN